MSSSQQRVLYLPHGGGPMPIMGDPSHAKMVEFLKRFGESTEKPSAILLISAHWEAPQPTIISSANPGLYFDYSGFPPEFYEIDYPAVGEPELAEKIHTLLDAAGLNPAMETQRGFDHGVFIPLMLMYPDADIPIVELSLVRGLDPQTHIDMGKAIAGLEWDNLLVIGSGMSFHNPRGFQSTGPEAEAKAESFHHWLHETCAGPDLTEAERDQRLANWEAAPNGRFCHPREEHLIPLHVCYGYGAGNGMVADVIFYDEVITKKVSGLLWQ